MNINPPDGRRNFVFFFIRDVKFGFHSKKKCVEGKPHAQLYTEEQQDRPSAAQIPDIGKKIQFHSNEIIAPVVKWTEPMVFDLVVHSSI